jgi:hypothetical protein
MKKQPRIFQSPNGVTWRVEVRSPGSSNAMIVFAYPDPGTSRLDRYAWHQWQGSEASVVTARLQPAAVLESLTDDDLKRLFRRSMPIYNAQEAFSLLGRKADR